MLTVPGCAREPEPQVYGVYAHDSRVLLRLDYDYDGDGRIDVRTYMRDGKPARLEGDRDGDDVIDRWEYYGTNGELLRIGASSRGDGREDTWVSTHGDVRTLDMSTRRDNTVDRRETYRGDTLERVETDTNHDGLMDRWEEFQNGALVRVLLDDERRLGKPTRRIVYGPKGAARVERIEGSEEATDVAR